jgi:hypothetical protein
MVLVGALGLGLAAYGFVSLGTSAVRHRRYADIALAVLVAAVAIAALIAFGDRLVQ